MHKYIGALFCALLVLSVLEPIKCRKSGRGGGFGGGGSHSYPSHGGLSGSGRGGGSHGYPSSGGLSGGSHGYPSSGGLSGSGGSHSYPSSGSKYPSSGGLSGSGGSHSYPSSGGSKYPSSGGLSGSGGSHSYPPSGGSKYPSSGGISGSGGSHSYPSSGGGLSGGGSKYPSSGIISVCWVAGAGVGLLPLFGWHADAPASGCYFVEVMDYNYLVFLYFATIVTPSVLMAAFYAHIYRVVLKQLSAVVTVDGSRGRFAGGTMLRVLGAAQKREVKATQNLAIIVFFFIICWIPLYTINAVKAFMPDLDIPNTLTYFCIIFSHLNSAINPLLYAYHLKDFRAALRGLICTLIGRGVVPIPAAYRPPVPMRRPALERCNALRERPRIYVHSPVWLREREAEMAAAEQRNRQLTSIPVNDVEPFIHRLATDSSSGRHTPEGREDGPYLIRSNEERCQSPYKRVEDFLRRVRSVNGDS